MNEIPVAIKIKGISVTNAVGIDFSNEMINIAIREYKNNSKKVKSFDSNILEGFNGSKGSKGLKK